VNKVRAGGEQGKPGKSGTKRSKKKNSRKKLNSDVTEESTPGRPEGLLAATGDGTQKEKAKGNED